MGTLICRTCGCSLVRLGIAPGDASMHTYQGETHPFCCGGCVDVFLEEPERYLAETGDLIVCPTCLAEKPRSRARAIDVEGEEVYFCHCPPCAELYRSKPDFYRDRLAGRIPSKGVFDHTGCCLGSGGEA
jgi:YHS domain-containing protein